MLHPTVRLILWGATVASTQLMPLPWLVAAAALCIPAAALLARSHFFLLLRRTRWLLLSIAILFALATPGLLLLPEMGSLGPTREGAMLAFTHLLRLTLVLALLAILLQFSPMENLVAGLYGLLWPLAWLGLERERVALRLLLVMRYVEQAPRGGNWREWLEHAEAPAQTAVMRWRVEPLAPLDYFALMLFVAALALAAWKWA